MPAPSQERKEKKKKKKMALIVKVLAFIVLLLLFELLFRLVFLCPCDLDYSRHVWFCVLYIMLPACIFFNACILLDQLQRKACIPGWIWTRRHLPRGFFRCCCVALLKAVSMGLLWLIVALLNGDWYVCLMSHSNNTAVEEQLACQGNMDVTRKDEHSVRYYTNVSRFLGLGLILAVVSLWLGASCCSVVHGQPHLLQEQQDEEETGDQTDVRERPGLARGQGYTVQ